MPGENGEDNPKEQSPGSGESKKNVGQNPSEESRVFVGPGPANHGSKADSNNRKLDEAGSSEQSEKGHFNKANENNKETQGNERNGREPTGVQRPPYSKYTGIYEEKNYDNFKQANFCDSRLDDNLVYDDQEEFTVDGLSVHDFRGCSNIGSETCLRRRGMTTQRPVTRTTSEKIRDIEKDYEQGHLQMIQEKAQRESMSETETESKQNPHKADVFAKHEPIPSVVASGVGQGFTNNVQVGNQQQAEPVDAHLNSPAGESEPIQTEDFHATFDSSPDSAVS